MSVVIPAYQAERCILAAVSSACRQTAPAGRVIVVDDGSTDGTADLVRRHHPDVHVVTIAHGGEAAARNAGLRAAQTEWVAFLDADDRYLPNRLEAVAGLLEVDSDLDAVTTDAFMEVGGDIRGLCYGPGYRFAAEDQALEILRRNFVFGHVVARRQRLLDLGGFDESITHTADWAMWMELLLDGGRIGFVDRPLSVYRVHPASASADVAAMIRGSRRTLERARFRTDLPPGGDGALEEAIAANERNMERRRLADAIVSGEGVRGVARAVLRNPNSGRAERVKAALALVAPGVSRRVVGLNRRGRTLATAGWLVSVDEKPGEDGAVDSPLVSVILPFLDEIRFLEGAVETVLAQTLSSWELILVDDGSSDGSGEIADDLARRHPERLRVLRHPQRRRAGLAASRNLGLSDAKASAVAFLNADDRWEPEKLERQLRSLAESPEAGMVAGSTRYHRLDGSGDDEIHPIGDRPALMPRGALARALVSERIASPPPPAAVLYRTGVLRAVGGVPDGKSQYEDQRTYVVVSLAAPTLITDDVLTIYSVRDDSIYGRLVNDSATKSRDRRRFEWWAMRVCASRALRHRQAIPVAATLARHRLRVAIGRWLGTRRHHARTGSRQRGDRW